MKIKNVIGREILDSRGNPTVEVDVVLENGIVGRAAVPSGASTGVYEALELRDGGTRYLGRGVLIAVENVNGAIRTLLIGREVEQQKEIDEAMILLDGTLNKSRLGANAILGVSLAVLHASALNAKMPLYRYVSQYLKTEMVLPRLMINIINGGVHANWSLDFQEFMIIPHGKDIKDSLRIGAEVFQSLMQILRKKGFATSVGDEGGFAPALKNNEDALLVIMQAIKKAGYQAGVDVFLALDVAASELYKNGKYYLAREGKEYTTKELISFYEQLVLKYPIISIEDPLDQGDWVGFQEITRRLGKKILIVGDDLFVTNTTYLQRGIKLNAGNAILIKPNQIGTVTETIETIVLARKHQYQTILSHRSGETTEGFLSDLAVGFATGWIKAGSLSRGERICKYNQLLRIEEEIKIS